MGKIVYSIKTLNTRYIIISIIIAGAVTWGNLWIHSNEPQLGYERYTGYGISFDYDLLTQIREQDFTGYGLPSDSGGSITAVLQSKELLKQWGVFWVKPEIMPSHMAENPESAIDFLFENAGMAGTQIVDRSEYSISRRGEYDLHYQNFGVQESGITIPGVIGALYSEDQARYVIIYLIYIADLENPEEPHEDLELLWYNILDSIKLIEITNKLE